MRLDANGYNSVFRPFAGCAHEDAVLCRVTILRITGKQGRNEI